jgi:hypothetical protein
MVTDEEGELSSAARYTTSEETFSSNVKNSLPHKNQREKSIWFKLNS